MLESPYLKRIVRLGLHNAMLSAGKRPVESAFRGGDKVLRRVRIRFKSPSETDQYRDVARALTSAGEKAMPFPRGHNRPLPLARKLMCEFLHFSRQVPAVTFERRMNLQRLVFARDASPLRPSWFSLFLKGYARVARRHDLLRTAFMRFPWPHLHQHEANVASLAIGRRIGEEDVVLFLQIRDPESIPIPELDAQVQNAKTAPLESIPCFRRQLRSARLPWPLRRIAWWAGLQVVGDWRARHFGTFGVSGVASRGAATTHLLTPITTTLTFDVVVPNSLVPVRLICDHRVMDGVFAAGVLVELEEVLCGPIADEVSSLARRAA